jgi:uncharacterized protein YkwD
MMRRLTKTKKQGFATAGNKQSKMGIKLLIKCRAAVADNDDGQQQNQGKTRRRFFSLIRDNKQTYSTEVNKVLGGKYLSKKAQSLRSLDTVESSENTESWKSCSRRDYNPSLQISDEERRVEWGKAISDARRLPQTGQYISNHILVNKERSRRIVPALKRSRELDSVARWHAEIMASEGLVRHSDPAQLQGMLEDSGTCLGENVASGECIQVIHKEMLQSVGDLRNMTDRRYKEMGWPQLKEPTAKYSCAKFSEDNCFRTPMITSSSHHLLKEQICY